MPTWKLLHGCLKRLRSRSSYSQELVLDNNFSREDTGAMDIDFRLRRVWYVTSRYPQLQGLRLVPLAVVFLLSACWRAGLLRLPGDHTHYGPEVWFSSGVAIAVMLAYLARAWYARHVGAIG